MTNPQEQDDTTQSEGISFQTMGLIVVGGFIGIYLFIFLIGFIAALIFQAQAASFFRYLKDLLTIGLSLSSLLIFVSFALLVLQIARLVNLIKNGVQPITEDAQKTVATVRSTVTFVQKQGVEPIIRTQSFMVGLLTFLREFFSFARFVTKKPKTPKE